jgi:WD40 repeat protein
LPSGENCIGKKVRLAFGKSIPQPRLTRLANPPLPRFELQAGSRVDFSPNGAIMAHAGFDGAVHIWDAWTAKELATFKGHFAALNAVAFAPDGKSLASASDDVTALVWDVSNFTKP